MDYPINDDAVRLAPRRAGDHTRMLTRDLIYFDADLFRLFVVELFGLN